MIVHHEVTCPVEFLLTKDELAFARVLNDFSNTRHVFIATYHILNRNDSLLEHIKQLPSHVETTLITKIPNRWRSYNGESDKSRARKEIGRYLRELKPSELGERVSVYFQYANHAKIIATDNIAYIGSANFAPASANNFECGAILRDKEAVERLTSSFFLAIHTGATRYYGTRLSQTHVQIEQFVASVRGALGILNEEDESLATSILLDYCNSEVRLEIDDLVQSIGWLIEDIRAAAEDEKGVYSSISAQLVQIDTSAISSCHNYIDTLSEHDSHMYMSSWMEEQPLPADDDQKREFQQYAADAEGEHWSDLTAEAAQRASELTAQLNVIRKCLEKSAEIANTALKQEQQIDNT